MSIGAYTAAAFDMSATADAVERNKTIPGFYLGNPEGNPLARPFVQLPRPAYYACGFALTTGVNWIAYEMSKSKKWNRVWWLPQSISIGANTHGCRSQQVY